MVAAARDSARACEEELRVWGREGLGNVGWLRGEGDGYGGYEEVGGGVLEPAAWVGGKAEGGGWGRENCGPGHESADGFLISDCLNAPISSEDNVYSIRRLEALGLGLEPLQSWHQSLISVQVISLIWLESLCTMYYIEHDVHSLSFPNPSHLKDPLRAPRLFQD